MTGCDYAGKTCIINTILHSGKNMPPRPEGTLNQKATHGLNIQFADRNQLTLALYDLPGLKRHRHLVKSYYDFTDLIIFVVSMTNPKRLLEARGLLREMIHNTTLHGVPVLVYCNKHDRKIRTNQEHIRKVFQLDDIKDRHWHIQECSALTGYGLEVGLEWACNELLKGRLAHRLRRIVTAPVTHRHGEMLRQMIADNEALNNEPMKLKNIQTKFEFISGILYGLSSLMSALEDLELPWQRTYSCSPEVAEERRRLRLEVLNYPPEGGPGVGLIGESKVETDENTPLLSAEAEQKTETNPTPPDHENNTPAPEVDELSLNAPDPGQKSSLKSPDPGQKAVEDKVERTPAPETNEETAPLLSST